jgi:hypothetical protein
MKSSWNKLCAANRWSPSTTFIQLKK